MNKKIEDRKLILALACRNDGSRLYGKPLQNLNIEDNISILDNIIQCLKTIDQISDIVLGVSEGIENEIFHTYAQNNNILSITGNKKDVLSRLILSCEKASGTDVFRVTSESPFPSFERIEEGWKIHKESKADATFLDDVIDGCNFEIFKLKALKISHSKGENKHRSELCSLFIRENPDKFKIIKLDSQKDFFRKELRLTVDNPEDLVVCRRIYNALIDYAPNIPIKKIIEFLDKNPDLINLTLPFTEDGYKSMYL